MVTERWGSGFLHVVWFAGWYLMRGEGQKNSLMPSGGGGGGLPKNARENKGKHYKSSHRLICVKYEPSLSRIAWYWNFGTD